MGKIPRGQQGPGCRPRSAKEGQTDTGNGVRCRHAAQSVEIGSRGWWVWSRIRGADIRSGRGGGYLVLHRGVMMTNSC